MFTSKVSEDGSCLCMRNTVKEITLRFLLTQYHLGTEILVLGNAASPREDHAPILTPHDLLMFRFLWPWKQAQLTGNLWCRNPTTVWHAVILGRWAQICTACICGCTGCLLKRKPRKRTEAEVLGSWTPTCTRWPHIPITPGHWRLSSVYTSSKILT